MRIFVAGASGVLGSHLLPLLIADGHEVAGMTRTAAHLRQIGASGAAPVLCNVYDRTRLKTAIHAFAPDLVLHQLTDLPDDAARISEMTMANARIRTEGTRNLLAATAPTGARTFAQSTAWQLPTDIGREAVEELEHLVLDSGGSVLRYGRFYGPGTYRPASPPKPPRVDVRTAARLTVKALTMEPGVLVLDDESPLTSE